MPRGSNGSAETGRVAAREVNSARTGKSGSGAAHFEKPGFGRNSGKKAKSKKSPF